MYQARLIEPYDKMICLIAQINVGNVDRAEHHTKYKEQLPAELKQYMYLTADSLNPGKTVPKFIIWDGLTQRAEIQKFVTLFVWLLLLGNVYMVFRRKTAEHIIKVYSCKPVMCSSYN